MFKVPCMLNTISKKGNTFRYPTSYFLCIIYGSFCGSFRQAKTFLRRRTVPSWVLELCRQFVCRKERTEVRRTKADDGRRDVSIGYCTNPILALRKVDLRGYTSNIFYTNVKVTLCGVYDCDGLTLKHRPSLLPDRRLHFLSTTLYLKIGFSKSQSVLKLREDKPYQEECLTDPITKKGEVREKVYLYGY